MWQRWLDAWVLHGEKASVGDEWDEVLADLVPPHWRPCEQRAITCSPQAPEVADHDADQVDHETPVRRAAAEVRGWPEVAGHQRCNRGWQGRHRGSVDVGCGLKVREATKEERRLGERIAHCGEHLIFRAPRCECDPHARPVLVGADLCTHRLCHHCARLRSRRLGARVREMVEQLRGQGITRYALLTLTYRDSEVLEGSVSRCWRDFRKLRQRKLWHQVLGCVATMEIKRGKRSRLWHPHLHVLVARPSCTCLRGRRLGDGGPTCAHGKLWCPHALNQCCASEAWREITGDSFVVDIRAVHADDDGSMAGAVREVVKYCTKLTDVSAKEREDGESDVLELHRAIRGRRLLTTTGVFRGWPSPRARTISSTTPRGSRARSAAHHGRPWSPCGLRRRPATWCSVHPSDGVHNVEKRRDPRRKGREVRIRPSTIAGVTGTGARYTARRGHGPCVTFDGVIRRTGSLAQSKDGNSNCESGSWASGHARVGSMGRRW